ncbi:glycosyltransferase [Microbacterium sp. nov. GSS16]|uniref:glycosyltransferase n=1 Tax=Microbacterium sp. nov. GSS16 TaxID=3019890 RepID=UPI0023066B88|nr:glycosyltransferase [Microbacterium sp. nov. GSS16]WCD92896.1 DUF1972 domain-containing protein [Microbacterium sp. nov. GSS16]
MELMSTVEGRNKRMKSVAIIGTRGYPSYYGGFETAVRKLAPYLADKGWDVSVYSRPGQTRADDINRDSRVQVVETVGLDSSALTTLTYGLTSVLHAKRRRPDVALVMNVANGFWLSSLRRAGIPTVVNVDGIEWDRDKWGRVAKRVFREGARLTAKHSTGLIFDSVEIARYWKSEFNRFGDYIPYGGEAVEVTLPVEEGLNAGSYVLMVARFVPENSVPQFLEAASSISQHLDVVIVGSSGFGGALDEAAQMLAGKNPRIHWLKHISDDRRLFSLWQHASVYFHGHTVGGTNPALVQAMALGVPVVARDTVFNREVLGDAGHFCDGGPADIAEKVLQLAADYDARQAAGRRGQERATEFYNWHLVCARYEQSLNRAVSLGV